MTTISKITAYLIPIFLCLVLLFLSTDGANNHNSRQILDVIDTSAILRQLSVEGNGNTYQIKSSSIYQLSDLKIRIVVLHTGYLDVSRFLVLVVDSLDRVKRFYDSGIIVPECGVPDLMLSSVSFQYLSGRPLVIIEERRYEVGCCGASMKEIDTCLFYDVLKGFRKVLKLEKSKVDYNDDECGTQGHPSYRYTYFFPNGCLDDKNCSYLSFFTLSSDKKFHQKYFAYKWNKDSTALVPF